MPDAFEALSGQWSASLPAMQDLLLHLLLTLVLSQLLAWVYVRTHHGVSYSRATVQAMIVLSLVISLVIFAVGDSLSRAFGLFGALALIRFRTPIKDTRDTVFLFLALGVGVAVGSRSLMVAVVGTLFTCSVLLYLHWTRFGERSIADAVLRLRLPALEGSDQALRVVLDHYCRNFCVLQINQGPAPQELELAYQLEFRDRRQSPGLVADVRAIPGAGDVSLMMQDHHEEI